MEKTVIALFDNLETAQTAVRELLDNGFSRDDISVVRTNQQGDYTSGNMVEDDADAGGAAAGAGIGAVLGGLAGLLVGLGALAIPGIGPIIAAGPLATALAGAGLGAATGGLVGALADAGIPEKEAGAYAEGVRRGGTLVTVRADEDQVDRASEILNRFTPVDINQRAGDWQGLDWSGNDASAGPYGTSTGAPHTRQAEDMPQGRYQAGESMASEGTRGPSGDQSDYRTQEGMTGENSGGTYEGTGSAGYTSAGTTYQGTGSFTSNTGVSEEQMQEQDPTVHPRSSEGDYQARRDFLGGPDTQGDYHRDESGAIQTGQGAYGSQGQDFQPSQASSSQGHAMEGQLGGHQGSLAGGESFASGAGDLDAGTTGTTFRAGPAGRFEDYDADFRSDWDNNYRDTGAAYVRYQPAYQYGWRLGEQYQGQNWNDFEANARADWERSQPDDAWQDFKDAIRYGWERFRNSAQNVGQRTGQVGYDAGQGYDRTVADMSRGFDIYDQDFRSDWQRAYGSTGYGYERYQPAYMYGFNLATEPRHQGRKWNEIEYDARRDWETRHPNDAWDDFKEAVRHAWDRVRGESDVQD